MILKFLKNLFVKKEKSEEWVDMTGHYCKDKKDNKVTFKD
jgi:hypothetical protein